MTCLVLRLSHLSLSAFSTRVGPTSCLDSSSLIDFHSSCANPSTAQAVFQQSVICDEIRLTCIHFSLTSCAFPHSFHVDVHCLAGNASNAVDTLDAGIALLRILCTNNCAAGYPNLIAGIQCLRPYDLILTTSLSQLISLGHHNTNKIRPNSPIVGVHANRYSISGQTEYYFSRCSRARQPQNLTKGRPFGEESSSLQLTLLSITSLPQLVRYRGHDQLRQSSTRSLQPRIPIFIATYPRAACVVYFREISLQTM